MQYQRLGSTEFMASRLGFGGASISGEGKGYGFGPISFEDSVSLVRDAYEMGINIFDTAPIYGFGESEKRIGKAVRPFRDKAFIISKSGVHWHSNMRVDMNNDPAITKIMLEDSLKRLDIDYIDLYMIHWPDSKWDIRYPLEVIFKAQQQGKIKYIGLCNTTLDDLTMAHEVCKISAIQCEHNLFTQEKLESLSDAISTMDLGFMAWGTLDKGILSGRVNMQRNFESEDARSWAPWWNKKLVAQKVKKVEKLQLELPEYSLLDLALGFNLQSSFVTTSLCGARTSKQLESLSRALENKIDPNILNRAQEILGDTL